MFQSRKHRKLVIGVIHVAPLPGTPFSASSFDDIRDQVLRSAAALQSGGADGCLVQTSDRVYSTGNDADPIRVAAMALIVRDVVAASGAPFDVGVQIMRNAVSASLAVARIAGGTFIRATAFAGATPSADGVVEARPLEVAAYRRQIDANGIHVIADVASMHHVAHGSAATAARQAVNAGANAVALCDPDEAALDRLVAEVRAGVPKAPIVLAGHSTHANAARMLKDVDGAFVGRCLERDGWGSLIDVERVRAYMDVVRTRD
jgi:membrane complex biogenesis BtpA family protein